MTTIYYHFTRNMLLDGRAIPPVGEWLVFEGAPVPCKCGLHASPDAFDALQYAPGNLLHQVELGGIIPPHGSPVDKYAAQKRKIIATIDAGSIVKLFARRVALDVIHLWDAPKIVKEYLETGDEYKRVAARDAAGVAARAAARDAAWAAAWDAARDAARAAARDAAGVAARAAAWDAARDAAGVAARAAAWDAARDAAWAAARDAAGVAARAAARDAAWAAAWDAARDAAWAAAWDAARDAAWAAAWDEKRDLYRGWFNEMVVAEFDLQASRKEVSE